MDIHEVADLKQHIEDEFKKDTDAIDRVLALLAKRNGHTTGRQPDSIALLQGGRSATAELVQLSGSSEPNQDGLKKIAKARFDELPPRYTKREVLSILLSVRPGERINPNTLSGVMRELVDAGLARVKTPAVGRSAQVYEKL